MITAVHNFYSRFPLSALLVVSFAGGVCYFPHHSSTEDTLHVCVCVCLHLSLTNEPFNGSNFRALLIFHPLRFSCLLLHIPRTQQLNKKNEKRLRINCIQLDACILLFYINTHYDRVCVTSPSDSNVEREIEVSGEPRESKTALV